MRRSTSMGLTAMFFIFALAAPVLAGEKGTQTEPKKKEQVVKPGAEGKKLVRAADNKDSSWSNVKALWD